MTTLEEALTQGQGVERFWSRVDKTDGCWLWTGPMRPDGYGRFYIDSTDYRAHRVAYFLLVGEVPEGLVIDHLCRVRHCVNPMHMEPVMIGENVMRGQTLTAANAVKEVCPRGHPYTPENTRLQRGSRACRTCINALAKERRIIRAQQLA